MAAESWKPASGDAWRTEPNYTMEARPKKSSTMGTVHVRDGEAFVRANDRIAAGIGWTGLLHVVYLAARMSPAFSEECRRVLQCAHLDRETLDEVES